MLEKLTLYVGVYLLLLHSKIRVSGRKLDMQKKKQKKNSTRKSKQPMQTQPFDYDEMMTTTSEMQKIPPDVPGVRKLTPFRCKFSVAWIRKRDLHILTTGSSTYTSDQRFQVIRPENSINWTLQIKYPQVRDSGVYECQINTEPKMSLSYVLNVIELRARILGPADIFVKSGSEIIMTCVIQQGPHDLGTVFWYKGNTLIESTTQENSIHSGGDNQRITVETDWTDGLTSRLKIKRAVQSDTGNYTCVPTMAKSSSVYAHVISGEHPAAMQHNSAPGRTRPGAGILSPSPTASSILLFYVTLLVHAVVSSRFKIWRHGGNHDVR
ncbi:zwei Ig domain protein zig-8-like [Uranotaenia lowii]|uniref:zwei Ig domain protein zig-8-like n=1 Tax=Uranotaenia lowii TaxID=190385 RepID=UPI00247AE18C|nr:zwei Ig domain protein zig-8-like [Uranotaenia lowii]